MGGIQSSSCMYGTASGHGKGEGCQFPLLRLIPLPSATIFHAILECRLTLQSQVLSRRWFAMKKENAKVITFPPCGVRSSFEHARTSGYHPIKFATKLVKTVHTNFKSKLCSFKNSREWSKLHLETSEELYMKWKALWVCAYCNRWSKVALLGRVIL